MRIFKNKRTPRLLLSLIFLTIVAVADIQLTAIKDAREACEKSQADLMARLAVPLSQQGIGKALYAYDFTTGTVLYDKDGEEPLPLASLTKLMTVRVAMQQAPDPDAYYTITAPDLAPDGSIGMSPGQSYTIRSLAYAALIPSSNDAAEALMHSTKLSDQLFFGAMDAQAEQLGLPSLSYQSATGLDNDDGTASSRGSAQDIAKLLYADATAYPTLFDKTTEQSSSITSSTGVVIPLQSTNAALDKLPLLTAGKTGYTLTAGGNLAILWSAATPRHDTVGAVVLGSTEDGRFDDMVLLYDTANAMLAEQNAATCAD